MSDPVVMIEPTHNPSSFEPMLHHKSEIRLITLLPGSPADPLVVSPSTVSLLDFPHYEALSYVWGPAADKRSLQVNDIDLLVPTNLERVLHHMRLLRRSRDLWADAICINQSNLVERAKQVALMGNKYKQARTILVLLGDGDDDSKIALSWNSVVYCEATQIDGPIWVQAAARLNDQLHVTGCCSVDKLCSNCLAGTRLIVNKLMNMLGNYHVACDLLEVVTQYRAQEATDPRDKIYGLLRLAKDEQVSLTTV